MPPYWDKQVVRELELGKSLNIYTAEQSAKENEYFIHATVYF